MEAGEQPFKRGKHLLQGLLEIPDDHQGCAGPQDIVLTVKPADLLWREVPSFFGRGPDEHVYVTHTDAGGNTTVIFGDGRNGARLPTGQENVRAIYRKGIGSGGILPVHRLTQLLSRPAGLKEVTNPLPLHGHA